MKTKEQIDETIAEIKELGSRIKSIDNLIAAIDIPELKEKYNQDLLTLIERYKRRLSDLDKDLTEYVRYEREQNLPVTFLYRRILKTLRS